LSILYSIHRIISTKLISIINPIPYVYILKIVNIGKITIWQNVECKICNYISTYCPVLLQSFHTNKVRHRECGLSTNQQLTRIIGSRVDYNYHNLRYLIHVLNCVPSSIIFLNGLTFKNTVKKGFTSGDNKKSGVKNGLGLKKRIFIFYRSLFIINSIWAFRSLKFIQTTIF